MKTVYEDEELAIKVDRSGFYVFTHSGFEFFEDIESVLRYSGAVMTDPADFIRMTAERFRDD